MPTETIMGLGIFGPAPCYVCSLASYGSSPMPGARSPLLVLAVEVGDCLGQGVELALGTLAVVIGAELE